MSKSLGRFSMQSFLDIFSGGGSTMMAKVVVPSYFFYMQYSIHEQWQHGNILLSLANCLKQKRAFISWNHFPSSHWNVVDSFHDISISISIHTLVSLFRDPEDLLTWGLSISASCLWNRHGPCIYLNSLVRQGTIFNCSLANTENTKQHGEVWFISRWVRWQESFQPSLTKGPLWTTSLRDLVWFIWMDPPKTIVEYSRHGEVPWGPWDTPMNLYFFTVTWRGTGEHPKRVTLEEFKCTKSPKRFCKSTIVQGLDPSNGALLVRVDRWKLILIGWNLSMVH